MHTRRITRDSVHTLQAILCLARLAAVHQPLLAQLSIDLISDIFCLPEEATDTLDFSDRAGRASVKDVTGIDIKQICVEILLVRNIPVQFYFSRISIWLNWLL